VLVVLELATLDMDGRLAAGLVLVLACAVLVPRRRWPLVTGTVAGILCSLAPWAGPAMDEVATPILILAVASYSLARWIEDYRGLAGVGVTLLCLSVDYATVDLRAHNVSDAVFLLALLLPPYVFGRITKRLADYGRLLEREQDLVRREAIRDERDRIARELHDVIAHSVSAMVVQVAAAQDLVRTDPARAEEMLGRVADTGRQALAETGRLLHVIRDTEDELGLTPTPGLRDLDTLVEDFREQGLAVDLVLDAPDDLPVAVDVSAYRIVREALTNAQRYAPDRSVQVEVLTTSSGLTVRTVNRTDGGSGLGSGLGLRGLAERIELLGGTLRHGATGDGRYELVATLPGTRELV